jgi:hypothetical protein
MMTNEQTVLTLWCRLTGRDVLELDGEERAAFLARPQLPELARTPYPELLEAAVMAARRGSLPLELWLTAVRELVQKTHHRAQALRTPRRQHLLEADFAALPYLQRRQHRLEDCALGLDQGADVLTAPAD